LKAASQGQKEEIQTHLEQIQQLERNHEEANGTIKSRDESVEQQKQVIELLQNKLGETQDTLLSNNSTIDSLKQSLAEAQKYSFRAILNNRQGVHHPAASMGS
jgi:chromosome segregation ATPase